MTLFNRIFGASATQTASFLFINFTDFPELMSRSPESVLAAIIKRLVINCSNSIIDENSNEIITELGEPIEIDVEDLSINAEMNLDYIYSNRKLNKVIEITIAVSE